jgi:hypothetical protein
MKSALVQDPPLIFFKFLCCVVVENIKRSYAVKVKNLRIFFANTNSTSKSLSGFRNYSLRIFLQTHLSCLYVCTHQLTNTRHRSCAVNAKTYIFTLQIRIPLADASKIYRIYGYSTLSDYW